MILEYCEVLSDLTRNIVENDELLNDSVAFIRFVRDIRLRSRLNVLKNRLEIRAKTVQNVK